MLSLLERTNRGHYTLTAAAKVMCEEMAGSEDFEIIVCSNNCRIGAIQHC